MARFLDIIRFVPISESSNISLTTMDRNGTSATKSFHADMVDTKPRQTLRPSFPGMGIPMLKIRLSRDSLIFNMGIPILVRKHLYIETAPWILTSPGKLQQYYWLCKTGKLFAWLRINLNNLLHFKVKWWYQTHIDGLVQDCINSSALTTQLSKPCTKPSICIIEIIHNVKMRPLVSWMDFHKAYNGM